MESQRAGNHGRKDPDQKLLQTSQIYVINAEDVKVYRDKNDVVLDASLRDPLPVVLDR